MELTPLGIEGAWVASSPVWKDDRGSFREWFKGADLLKSAGIDFRVGQANISVSDRGVIRGIHYSLAVAGQAKYLTCISGAMMDVVVDIRPASATFGSYATVDLVAGDGRAVFLKAGLGHGFISLENGTTVSYLLSSPYSPKEEYEINPLDLAIGINWGMHADELVLSSKDRSAPTLVERLAEGKLPI